ncbi:MAG: hypothetical protein ACRC1H_01515, partial [Caldilineaceae bacterium]
SDADSVGDLMAWVAALLAAGAAWSLNLSRIAVNYNATPLFAVAAVGLLLYGMRTQRAAAYLGAGLALGMGLNFYSSFRLFLPVLPIFVLAALLSQRRAGGSARLAWIASWRGLLLAGIAALVVSAPLLAFAALNPDLFLERSSKTFLFTNVAEGERWQVLWENVRAHLLMFNVEGDPNGRHNLPGRPMLDPLLAALLIPGVALCLRRLREPRHLLLLLWLGFTLLGGILTLAFEAPQSLRANGALPAAMLIALVPVAAIVRLWQRSSGKVGARQVTQPVAIGLAVLVAPVLLWNLVGYFEDQRTDFATWNAFSAPETAMARTLATLDPATNEAWVIVTSFNHPTV